MVRCGERENEAAFSWIGIAAAAACGVWIGTRLEDALLPAVLPLTIAAAASRLVSPSADAVSRAFRVSRKTGGAVWAVVLCGLAVWLTGMLGGRLAAELTGIFDALPGWIASAAGAAEELAGRLAERFLPDLPFPAMTGGGTGSAGLSGEYGGDGLFAEVLIRAASTLAERAADFFGRTVQGFPGGVLSMAVGAMAFVWLTADPGGAWASLERLLPDGERGDGARRFVGRVRDRIRRAEDAMGRYLRAYLCLTGVTFAELLPGFWLLGVENAPAAAFLTALVDILPVLGCGTVLVPWAAVSFLKGEARSGIGLLLLLAAVWVTRQILEPRFVGRAAGIHPFLALTVSYLSLRLFGGAGVLAAAFVLCLLSAEGEGE